MRGGGDEQVDEICTSLTQFARQTSDLVQNMHVSDGLRPDKMFPFHRHPVQLK